MRTSEAINEIAAALAHAQGAITNAEKDRVNPHLGNKYMTLTSVWDAIRKPLSDNGLSIVQVTEADDDGAVLLLTRLMHASGQYIEATYPVIGMENRGVNAAQAAGSALTYARRYSLTSLIGVVADEDDDAGAATGNRQQAKPQTQRQPATQAKQASAQQPPSTGPAWTQDAANDAAFESLSSASAERAGGNGKATPGQFEPEDGESVWADWRHMDDAKAWARTQNKFNGNKHLDNAYASVKDECKPKSARDMWRCWYKYVMAHETAKPVDVQPEPDEEMPVFESR